MPNFSKPFNFLRRMFPASGVDIPMPSEVTNSVQLVHELTKASFVNSEMRFRRDVQILVSAAAGDTVVPLLEPDPGFIQFPVMCTVQHDDPTLSKFVEMQILPTANPQDIWGAWDTTARTLGMTVVENTVAFAGKLALIPTPLCMTRGFQYRVLFQNLSAAGLNLRVHYYYLDVPGEFVTADLIIALCGKYICTAGTRAL